MQIKNIFLCALTNFRKWTVDTKIFTLFALILAFNLWNLSGIYEYAESVGYGVGPWVFSHIMNVPVVVAIYGCFAILLFSNAPFLDQHTPFLLVRTGRIPWLLGQLLYIVLASLVYTLVNYAISVVAFFPHIAFTGDWGKIIRTLAIDPGSAGKRGIDLTFIFDRGIVSYFSPIQATLLSLLLFFLDTMFVGVLIFSMNLIIGRISGILAAGILVFISCFSIFVGRIRVGLKVYYFSPLSWNSLRYVDWHHSGDSPSFLYAILFLLGASLVLSLASVVSFSKKDVRTREGSE